ncbi:hypothetical protein GCM10010530_34250 [Kribbella aluminosa]
MFTMPATYQTGLPSASIVMIMFRVSVVVFILTLSFGRSYWYVEPGGPESTPATREKQSAPIDDRGACPCGSRGEWDLHTLGGL